MLVDQPEEAALGPSPTHFAVQYAIPSRQALAAVGGVLLVTAAILVFAIWLRSPWVVAPACVVVGGGLAWWVFANLNARGDATLDRSGIKLAPRRRAFCAPACDMQIGWEDVAKVEAGVAESVKLREYVILRLSRPRRSLIVMPLVGEAPGFVQMVMELLNESRSRAGKPAIEARDPYSGIGWRVTAGLGLAVFAAMVVGAAFNAGRLDGAMVARMLVMGGFVFGLAATVFRAKRKR